MKKLKSVPVFVDESVVSLTAYQVVLITVFGLYFQQEWLFVSLSMDFLIRAFGLPFSPLAFVAKKISIGFQMNGKMVFAAPKRFSAFLGFVMSLIIAYFLESEIGVFLGFVLVILAAFEGVFKICIGCYLYNFLVLPIREKIKFP